MGLAEFWFGFVLCYFFGVVNRDFPWEMRFEGRDLFDCESGEALMAPLVALVGSGGWGSKWQGVRSSDLHQAQLH